MIVTIHVIYICSNIYKLTLTLLNYYFNQA